MTSDSVASMTQTKLWRYDHPFIDHPPSSTEISSVFDQKCISFQFNWKYSKGFPDDGYKWSSKEKPPSQSHFMFEGKKIVIIRCWNAENKDFKKTILHSEKKYIVRYIFDGGSTSLCGDFEKRMNSEEAKIVREVCIGKANIKAVQKDLMERGIYLSESKIRNQAKTVSSTAMNKENCGKKTLTSPIALSQLNIDRFPNSENWNGSIKMKNEDVRCWMYMDAFEDSIRLYTNSLPSKKQYEKHLQYVQKIENMRCDEREKSVDKFIYHYPNGIKYEYRMMFDTTFLHCDAYVSILTGEVPKFKTKDVKNGNYKNRFIVLALCIHSHKHKFIHEKFANFLKSRFLKFGAPDRAFPQFVTDGEDAFSVYEEILGWKHQRCELHIRTNLIDKFGRTEALKIFWLLFGKREGNSWDLGLMKVFNSDEFDEELNKLSSKISSEAFHWIESHKEVFLKTVSLKSKLTSGAIRFYETTNSLEQFNNTLRMRITRRTTADNVAKELIQIAREQLLEIHRSLRTTCGHVYCVDFDQTKNMNTTDLCVYMETIGLKPNPFFCWDLPRKLSISLNGEKMAEIAEKAKHFRVGKFESIFNVKDGDKYASVKRGKCDALECEKCANQLPYSFCSHVFAVLQWLDEDERNTELHKLDSHAEQTSEFSKLKCTANQSAGEKLVKRKGKEVSHDNFVRSTNRIRFRNENNDDMFDDSNSTISNPEDFEAPIDVEDSEQSEDSQKTDTLNLDEETSPEVLDLSSILNDISNSFNMDQDDVEPTQSLDIPVIFRTTSANSVVETTTTNEVKAGSSNMSINNGDQMRKANRRRSSDRINLKGRTRYSPYGIFRE